MHKEAARLRAPFVVLSALVACAASAQDKAQEAASTQDSKFSVLEYRVLGNHVLPQIEIERAVYPHLGPDKTLQDVEGARGALELAYRAAGYGTVFVDIPEQNVDQGTVRLRVTEGKLDRIKVEGATYFSAMQIRKRLPEAQQGAVPSLPALQEQLAAYNFESRDRSLVPVLAAGRQPGTVDLTLRVDDRMPVHASAEFNNQYTSDTSHTRALFSLSYDNLFNRLDSLSAQYQTTPEKPDEMKVLALSYTTRLGGGGDTLTFYHVDSNSDVNARFVSTAGPGLLSVLGGGKVWGTRLNVPFANSAAGFHSFTLGADYKDFDENIIDQAQTPVAYTNLSLGQTSVWRGEKSDFTFDTTANFGLRGLGDSAQEFADKGFKARSNYFYLRSDAILNTPMLLKGWTLRTRLTGQYAVEPIISNEQFSIAGSDGVRGYLEAEELGDTGLRISVQANAPTWRFAEDRLLLASFAFFDAARASALEPLEDQPRNTDLRSWGLGLNVSVYQLVDGSLVWARPLVSGTRTLKDDSRLLFSIRAAW